MSSSAIDVFGNQVDNFKNKVINGNFDFWQRLRGLEGSPFTITNSTADITAFVADRWFITSDMSGSDSFTASVEQKSHTTSQNKILSLPKYYTQFQGVVTENSTGNNTQCGFAQRIEGLRTLAGKQVTVSFWVKGSVEGYASFRVTQKFGSGGSPTAQANVGQRDFAIATGWTKVIFTFSMPQIASGAVIGNRVDDAIEIAFQTYCSKDFLKAKSKVNYVGQLDISQVQIEEGAQATLFDKRMPAVELDMCQRYFEVGFINETVYAKGTIDATDRDNFKFIPYQTKKKTYDVAAGTTWVPDPDLKWDNLVNSADTYDASTFDPATDINPDTVGHTVKHSIAGLNDVPDGSSGIRTGIISETQPEGFVINYNASSQPFGLVTLRGKWAVDAEIYQGETPT